MVNAFSGMRFIHVDGEPGTAMPANERTRATPRSMVDSYSSNTCVKTVFVAPNMSASRIASRMFVPMTVASVENVCSMTMSAGSCATCFSVDPLP